jgi:hypothetical protein
LGFFRKMVTYSRRGLSPLDLASAGIVVRTVVTSAIGA